jgi:hypothetical protein
VRHPLEDLLNADASDILSSIQKGHRAIVDVKGKLAEYYLDKKLAALKNQKVIEDYRWSDKDGQPDFFIDHRGKHLKMECKNVRSGDAYCKNGQYMVEIQKTRNSKDGTNTRGYRVAEFDILAVCLFNQTKQWEYQFIVTRNLEKRPEDKKILKIMQSVPSKSTSPWLTDLLEALNSAAKLHHEK